MTNWKKVFEEKVEDHHGFLIRSQAFGMHTRALTLHQTVGASLTILGGVLYGKARQAIEQEAGPIPLVVGDVSMGFPQVVGWMQAEEKKFLLPKVKADGLFGWDSRGFRLLALKC